MSFPWEEVQGFRYPSVPRGQPCFEAERFIAWARQLLDQVRLYPAEPTFDLSARLLTDNFFERRMIERAHDSLTGDDTNHVCIAHVFEAAYRELTALRIAYQHDVLPPPIHHPTTYVELAGIFLGQLDEEPDGVIERPPRLPMRRWHP